MKSGKHFNDSVARQAEVIYNKSVGKDCFRMGLAITPPLGPVVPGQFLHLKLNNGYETILRRPFSIFNILETAENEPSLVEIVYEIVGKGTRLMATMKSGTQLDALGPLGNGFWINKDTWIFILVGGGMGMAGLHLLLTYLKELGPNYKIYNLIGARTKEELYLADSFRRLTPDTVISTEDGSKGITGLVTDSLSKLLASLADGTPINSPRRFSGTKHLQVYACGPMAMINKVCELTTRKEVPCQVSLEQWMGCGVGICRACVCKVKENDSLPERAGGQAGFRYAPVCSEGPVFDAAEIYTPA